MSMSLSHRQTQLDLTTVSRKIHGRRWNLSGEHQMSSSSLVYKEPFAITFSGVNSDGVPEVEWILRYGGLKKKE